MTVANVFAPQAGQRPMLHGRWVRALVIAGLTNTEVRQHLLQDDLPCPNDIELDGIRTAWTPPSGFSPASLRNTDSVAFLCNAQVFPFFHETAALDALRILRMARAREMIEAGAICNVPVNALAEMLKTLLHFETNDRALQVYRLAFFDVASVSRTQLGVLVRERVQLSVARAAGGHDGEGVMRRALTNDARMLAASLPASNASWRAVLLALGHLPPLKDLGRLVDELAGVAGARAAQALLRGGRDDDQRAESFVNVLGKLRTIGQTLVAPQAGLIEELGRVRIEKDATRVRTLSELTADGDGVGSLDVAPTSIDEQQEVEDEKPSRGPLLAQYQSRAR